MRVPEADPVKARPDAALLGRLPPGPAPVLAAGTRGSGAARRQRNIADVSCRVLSCSDLIPNR